MKNRGGKREGAGAKPLPLHLKKNHLTCRISQWVLDDIESRLGSKGSLLEEAYIKANGLKEPEKV